METRPAIKVPGIVLELYEMGFEGLSADFAGNKLQ